MTLKFSDTLSIPPEALTETFAVLGKRGSGKTNFAVVLVEELVAAKLPVVVIDPVGVWWGLRSSADGKSEGLPITVLGGEHGDVPLEEHEVTPRPMTEEDVDGMVDRIVGTQRR